MLENDFTITDNGVLSYRGSVKGVLQSGQSTDICVERPVVRISVGAVTYLDPPSPSILPSRLPFRLNSFSFLPLSPNAVSSSQGAKTHRPDDDFTRHFVEFG